jgi:signal peptidase II|tara:strand:+ start:669 stop:1154 length:486 start_codon:yes stop_codon:yes gene_type:complete
MVLNIVLKKNISLIIVLVVFLLDRISKYIILKLSQPLGELDIYVTSFLNLQLIWNNGIAFGLFSFEQNIYYNLFTFLIITITFIIIWLSYKTEGLEKISYLLIIGGSFGNIFDRIFYSSVPDFIDISINNFHWFIFNVADIFISIGVILLIILEFFKKKIS